MEWMTQPYFISTTFKLINEVICPLIRDVCMIIALILKHVF